MKYELEEPAIASKATPGSEDEETGTAVPGNEPSRTQKEKAKKARAKTSVVVKHLDIIKDDFWERRPWILSGKPGKLIAVEDR